MKLFFKPYGEGPPLIILHGLLGAGGNWHTLSRSVFSEYFHVFALDLRNHGRSDHDDGFDYPCMVEDVRQFFVEHGLKSANVLGHSMGGKVAMWLALMYPDLVSRLIVADIAPRAYPPHHMHILNALKSIDLTAYTTRAAIDEALAEEIKDMGVRQFLLKNLASNGQGAYSWKMNLLVIYDNYPKVNEGIDTQHSFAGPVLFIKGGRSNYITKNDASQIQALFPASTVEEIPKSGHWVHAEAPKQFAELVLQFLIPG